MKIIQVLKFIIIMQLSMIGYSAEIPQLVQWNLENYNKTLHLLNTDQIEVKDCKNEYVYAAFNYASLQEDEKEVIRLVNNLLKSGANAAYCYQMEIRKYFNTCNLEPLQLLFDNGLDVNKGGFEGYSYLYTAAVSECSNIVEYLIQKGANVNSKGAGTSTGFPTPLIGAIIGKTKNGGDIQIVRYLLEHHADPNLPVENYDNVDYPIEVAVGYGRADILKLLVDSGAKIEDQGALFVFAVIRGTLDTVEYLLKPKFKVGKKYKKTALQIIDIRLNQLNECKEDYGNPGKAAEGPEFYNWPCENLRDSNVVNSYTIGPLSGPIYYKDIDDYRRNYLAIKKLLQKILQ